MAITKYCAAVYRWLEDQFKRIPEFPRNILVTVLFLCAAYLISGLLIGHTGGENNSALVFVLAVVFISLLTTGYRYGILASVVGGLVDCPVIGVPTSVGYGAAFGGVAALLSMLNSCASGVSVVNIDNGFGAGFLASRINQMRGVDEA